MTRFFLMALFAASVVSNIAFVKLSVGVPVRSLLAVVLLGFIIWRYPRVVAHTISQCRTIAFVIAYLAVIGVALTVANGDSVAKASGVLTEVYVQAFISILLIYSLCTILGLATVTAIVAGTIVLTLIFCVLQFAGVQQAWDIKVLLDDFQGAPPMLTTDRPPGLSFSAVHLGYQVYVLVAIALVWSMVKGTPAYLVVAILLVIVSSITAGNRSPLLGVLVLGAIYAYRFYPRATLMLGPLLLAIALPIVLSVMTTLEEAGVRAAETDDSSSVGRIVLNYFGWLLFQDNIFGYGLTFDSQSQWPQYWNALNSLENATIVQRYGIHNYFLNMLLMFGVFLAPLGLLLAGNRRVMRLFAWAFVGYFVNAFTHNEGPFHGDNIFWYGAVAILFLAQHTELEFNPHTISRSRESADSHDVAGSRA